MTTYSYRFYKDGDEGEINKLYEEITGRRRTKEAYFWQWFDAPGGKGEIWLIEADEGDGKKKLIGHHGIMPMRFSRGQDDLLFGKTENTFVHPDYRAKILYPRFETKFRNEYEPRFHALFSSVGSKEAIRQRKTQGYRFPAIWKTYVWYLRSPTIVEFFNYIKNHKMSSIAKYIFRNQKKMQIFNEPFQYSGITIKSFSKEEALKTEFFHAFWDSIKHKYGVTPSRDYRDLKWRFWENPYIAYHTLILDSATAGAGIAMVCMPNSSVIRIDDFINERPQSKAFGYLLKAVLKWAKVQGAFAVQFTTTDDSIEWIGSDNINHNRINSFTHKIFEKRRNSLKMEMPRKICNQGLNLFLNDHPWYITRGVFEGVQ
jgi:hypothetical protein